MGKGQQLMMMGDDHHHQQKQHARWEMNQQNWEGPILLQSDQKRGGEKRRQQTKHIKDMDGSDWKIGPQTKVQHQNMNKSPGG
ncbi:hypothetical protein niasHT_013762 [Heterodera trifolii]|uniref:Uncharacterized protein n=1 Tax=Heterodera trifolii TaxID=157864 RepID=A0ABD2L8Z9_9BILA